MPFVPGQSGHTAEHNRVAGIIDTGRLSDASLTATIGGSVRTLARTNPTVLDPWLSALRTAPDTAKVALVGPSTVDIAAAGVARHARWKFWIVPGGPLEGMTDSNVLNFGYNGQTGDQITSTAHMIALTTADPDLICASGLLINTVRATAWTLSDLTAALIVYVDRLRAACPGVPIVLETGNPFLTTNVSGLNYVTPNSEAQAKTDLMRLAHLSVIGRWPDVLVRDVQTEIYGATAVDSHPYMNDQIHPNSTGMDAEVDALLGVVGYVRPASTGQAVAARSASPYAAWTSYGREVEDTGRYLQLASGRLRNIVYGASGGTVDIVDFDFPQGQINNLKAYDIVELPGGITFQTPRTGTTWGSLSSTVARLTVTAGVVPAAASALLTTRGYVKVWRQSRPVDQTALDALLDTSWTFKKVGRVRNPTTAGANTYLDLEVGSVTSAIGTGKAAEWGVTTGDRLYVDGLGTTFYTVGTASVTAGAAPNAIDLRFLGLPSADRSGLFGRIAIVVGTR